MQDEALGAMFQLGICVCVMVGGIYYTSKNKSSNITNISQGEYSLWVSKHRASFPWPLFKLYWFWLTKGTRVLGRGGITLYEIEVTPVLLLCWFGNSKLFSTVPHHEQANAAFTCLEKLYRETVFFSALFFQTWFYYYPFTL